MLQCLHYGRAVDTFNMHTQMECGFVDEVAPSLTDMGELAPQESAIPMRLIIQSIASEYAEEYIVVEPVPMDSMIRYVVSESSLGCWRWQS